MKKQHFVYSLLKNYKGSFKFSAKESTKCYTKKQMKLLYFNDEYKIAGEYSNKKYNDDSEFIGDISVDNKAYPLVKYNSTNRLFYSEKGFLKCTNDDYTYVVLLKNVIVKRLILLLLFLLIVFSLTVLFNNKTAIVNKLQIDNNTIDWDPNLNDKNTKQTDAGVSIPGYDSITIPANTSDIKLHLGNPDDNPCYFIIKLSLDDGTVLYESQLIPPGKAIDTAHLSKPLSKGTYDGSILYDTYDLNSQTKMNSALLKIKINVQ